MTKPLTVLAGLAALVMLAGSACVPLPAGTDGNLGNQWPAMAAPEPWKPRVDECHNRFLFSQSRYNVLSCDSSHAYQTVHVGDIPGEAASKSAPPEPGSTTLARLWEDCDAKLDAYLGGAWRDRRLRPLVAVPTKQAWSGGSRWYTCTAEIIKDVNSSTVAVSQSLKGGFNTVQAVKFGCYDLPTGATSATARLCDEPHNTEFVGHFLLDASSWEQLDDDRETRHNKCQDVIARFVGASEVSTGTWVWYPTEDEWQLGDRTMRCFLWLNNSTVSKSLKGVGDLGEII